MLMTPASLSRAAVVITGEGQAPQSRRQIGSGQQSATFDIAQRVLSIVPLA